MFHLILKQTCWDMVNILLILFWYGEFFTETKQVFIDHISFLNII